MKKEAFKESIYNFKKAWKFARKQKKLLIGYFILSLGLCLISAIAPMLDAKGLLYLTAGKWNSLFLIAALILIVEITRNTCRFFSQRCSQIFFRETLLQIQYTMATEMLKLETEEIDHHSTGTFIDRLTKDTGDIANIFTQLNYSITDILSNIGVMAAIFIINKWVFLYFLIGLIILYLMNRIKMKKYFTLDKELRRINERNTGLTSELIRGMRDIKVLNAGTTFLNKLRDKLSTSNQERYKMSGIMRRYQWLTGSFQDVLTFLFNVLGIYLVSIHNLTISNFVILYMYQSQVYNLLSYMTQFLEHYKNFNVSAERVFQVLDDDVFKKEIFGEKHIGKINGDFEFKNVTFSYVNGKPILKNLNFSVSANETVSFVGKSGAGKSTIFSLLTRLYPVHKGKILIDGYDINTLDKDSIRDNISIITQNPYIFNFSLRENLKIVKEDVTDEEMIEACKMACLHDFIMTLENGYDTVVGEGGLTLSGGERQRLAIARALLKKTEIILFDEATSALDNKTQNSIRKAIKNMQGEYTILMIAHRLSTVIDSDRIIVIDEGKVVDEGTHEYLLHHSDLYRDLYEQELEEAR